MPPISQVRKGLRIESKTTREEFETEYSFNKHLHATLARHYSKHWKYSTKPDVQIPHPNGVYSRQTLKKHCCEWDSCCQELCSWKVFKTEKKKNHNIFAGFWVWPSREKKTEKELMEWYPWRGKRASGVLHTWGFTLHESRDTWVTKQEGDGRVYDTWEHVEILFWAHLYF